jgi:FkbM family methyltransferase
VAPGSKGTRDGVVNGSASIANLVSARRRGELTRDDYWAAMQEVHRRLQDYQQLVAASGLAALEIAPSGLRVRLDDGVRIGWDPEDFRSPPAVLLNEGEYESTEWRIVRALGTEARTVIDVGANIGWYSVRLAGHRGDRAGIQAFEPLPTTHRQLVDNVRLNGFEQRVAIHAFGLSDREEVVKFYLPERTGSVAASEHPLFGEEPQSIAECPIRRLDDVAAALGFADVDFIKCDIEGGEFGFLRGAEEVLATNRPTVLLEMLRKWAKAYGYHPNDIIEWMKTRGYVCAAISDRSVQPIAIVTDETKETNFLFVPTERTAAVTARLTPEMARVAFD